MGKELLFKTLNHEETNEVPWVPFAGVHAGAVVFVVLVCDLSAHTRTRLSRGWLSLLEHA